MNCQEFQNRVDTLARGALADARALVEASAHEESCAACAAMLADERALSTGLRALASGMKGVESPARVETSLLAAFRVRAASDDAEDLGRAGATPNVLPLTTRVPATRQWSWARTAAVASLAAAASLALFFVLVQPGAGVKRSVMIEPPPGALGARTPSEIAEVKTLPVVTEVNPAVVKDVASHALPDKPSRPTSAPRARVVNASYGAGGGRGANARPTSDARPQEIATEFITLGQYAQAEEGNIVRVELPRSALASFGLPVSAETAGGRVKADVLLGADGTARAIRFIR